MIKVTTVAKANYGILEAARRVKRSLYATELASRQISLDGYSETFVYLRLSVPYRLTRADTLNRTIGERGRNSNWITSKDTAHALSTLRHSGRLSQRLPDRRTARWTKTCPQNNRILRSKPVVPEDRIPHGTPSSATTRYQLCPEALQSIQRSACLNTPAIFTLRASIMSIYAYDEISSIIFKTSRRLEL